MYDLSGRLVRTLIDGPQRPGSHAARRDGTDDRGRRVASGVYFSRLEAAGFQATEPLSLIR